MNKTYVVQKEIKATHLLVKTLWMIEREKRLLAVESQECGVLETLPRKELLWKQIILMTKTNKTYINQIKHLIKKLTNDSLEETSIRNGVLICTVVNEETNPYTSKSKKKKELSYNHTINTNETYLV